MHSKESVLLRQQLLIDNHVQGSLLRRVAFYSFGCAIYFVVILVLTESMSDPDEKLAESIFRCMDEAIYWAPGLMLLTPVVAYDMLKVTNRFAGPMFRLKREMQRLIDGESVHPLNFRDGDFWTEMADSFNEIRAELHELREEKASWARRNRAASEIVSQRQLFTPEKDEEETPDDFLVNAD